MYLTGAQRRLVVDDDRKVRLDLVEPRELEIVNEVAEFFHGKTAREVSDYSQPEVGWRLAKPRETIPYHTAWLPTAPPMPSRRGTSAGGISKIMPICPEGYAIREGEGFLSQVRQLTGTVQKWDEIRLSLDWALSRNPTDSSISKEIIGNTRCTEYPVRQGCSSCTARITRPAPSRTPTPSC